MRALILAGEESFLLWSPGPLQPSPQAAPRVGQACQVPVVLHKHLFW